MPERDCMHDSRYIIGIDLGTTNIAAFYVDTYSPDLTIHKFPIPQIVAVGELAERDLLPSFCYLPAREELPEGALRLPWDEAPELTVGVFARDHGASSPSRQIVSAKSWLAHAGIDRSKPILPWGSDLGPRMVSPIEVTATFLRHLRSAWDQRFGSVRDRDGSPCIMAEQQTVVTIPASFDETARELTLDAARRAGLKELTLLEEPLAAFYAWLNRHEESWREKLAPGERVLVVDVGGGTTDFSFIEMDEQGGLHRFAVGDHLLLGGDNIDIAIARGLEQEWKTKLPTGEWAMLCQRARAAKEQILEGGEGAVDITLLSKGSSVLQNVRKAKLTREQVNELLESGFYPLVPADAPPPRRGATGIRQMGLPYAQEPAVTVHLLQFLRYASHVAKGGDGLPGSELLYPHKILFNGGSMKSRIARLRVLAALESWFPGQPAPDELAGEDYSLAVAIGAAYYGRVRRGTGVKVRGGISRAYFIKVAAPDAASRFVCVMARDTDESTRVEVPGNYRLQTNEKVLFELHSSATRLHDAPGELLSEEAQDDLSQVAPLVSVLRFGKGEKRAIDVRVATQLTEIGTLEVVLESLQTEHRWPLHFDLRPSAGDAAADAPAQIVVDAASTAAARESLHAIFLKEIERLPKLVNSLEQTLDLTRDEWSISILRELADSCLELTGERARTPQHEARWLNLTGFCMRPGFGDAADSLRMRELWKLWFEGVQHDRQPQVIAEWWVFWRRVASGLKSGHQIAIDDMLEKILIPKGNYRGKIREGDQAKQEMWRCLGSLEQLPSKRKRRIGTLLVERLPRLEPYEYWVLARLGARHLFHAPLNYVLPADAAAQWLRPLLDTTPPAQAARMRLFAISMIGAQTGERSLDLPPDLQHECQSFLADHQAPSQWQERLVHRIHESREEGAQILGDSLPIGLQMVDASD